jgi:hypothetical protein
VARNVTDKCVEDEDTECKDRHPKNSEAGERHRFIKAHRIKHVLCINCMKLIVKYFLVLEGHLAFG